MKITPQTGSLFHEKSQADSRIAKLAKEYPAKLIAFDMLMDAGHPMIEEPFRVRRAALERFVKAVGRSRWLTLSKVTRVKRTAHNWMDRREIEGIFAKKLDLPYRPGKRTMRKYKRWTTVDCVVGGLFFQDRTRTVDSLLLGLYDDEGRLNYVGDEARLG